MTAPWMPPLPEPVPLWYDTTKRVFTATQMRQAQADAARAALEQAAKVCDEYITAEAVRGAIRAMAKEITP